LAVLQSAILILSSLLLAVQINQSAWAGTFPGPNGQIAFAKGSGMDPDTDEIYVMNADGSEQTQLTDNDVSDLYPSWSPDGEKIAFASERDGGGIYVMNADDGSDVTRLTTEGVDPSWSPDGEKIAFTSFRDADDESEFNAIYVMNADDGSDVTRLTDPNADYSTIDWGTNTSSPDGKDNKDKEHDHKDKKHDQ
jgi:Tol biopolymer transport system component